jgi:hypothetical protein
VLDADVEEHTFELFVIDPKAKREPVSEIQIHRIRTSDLDPDFL